MSTQFEFTVPPDGSVNIVLPEKYYGKTVHIDVTETADSDDEKKSAVRELLDSVTLDQLAETHKTGIFSLIGILKNCDQETDGTDERYDALMEKYYRARDTD